jgi:hypothetical protein
MVIGEEGHSVSSRAKRTTQANQGQDISVTSDRDNENVHGNPVC